MVSVNCLDGIPIPMDQEKRVRRSELDLDAEAVAALEGARAIPSRANRGNEKSGHSPKCG
jgi:hypothetical protein